MHTKVSSNLIDVVSTFISAKVMWVDFSILYVYLPPTSPAADVAELVL